MGRRVKKAVYAYGSGLWELQKEILFVYDGWNLIQEKEVSATGDPLFDKFYVWGLDLSQTFQGAGGIGGLVCRVSGGEVRHYFYDANGNVGQLVDPEDGAVTARYEYDPFGNAVFVDGAEAAGNAFRFSTKYFKDENGFFYFGYRYYVPELGRWLSRDPINEEGGINLYVAVFNDYINNWEYLGKSAGGRGINFLFNRIKQRLSRRGLAKFFQVHHVIGRSVFNDPKYSVWLDKLGFHCDQISNLLILPNKLGKKMLIDRNSKHAKRSLHVGRHKIESYIKPITEELDNIQDLNKIGKISDCEARSLVIELQRDITKKLKNGELKLNDAKILDKASIGAVSFMGLVSFTLFDPDSVSADQRKMLRNKDIEEAKKFFQRLSVFVKAQEYIPGKGGEVVDFFNPLGDIFDFLDIFYSIFQLAPVDDPNLK